MNTSIGLKKLNVSGGFTGEIFQSVDKLYHHIMSSSTFANHSAHLYQESKDAIISINGVVIKENEDVKHDKCNVSHPMDAFKLDLLFKLYAACPDDRFLPVLKARCPELEGSYAHVVITEADCNIMELYFKNGLLHSPDAATPAVMLKDRHAQWYKHGLIHNAHGPAEIEHDVQIPCYALEGQYLNVHQWWKKKQQMRQKAKKRFIDVIKTSVLSKSSAVCTDLHPDVLKYL